MCTYIYKRAYQIGDQTVTPYGLDGLLRRLRLLLAVNNGHIRDVNLHEVVPARPPPQLAHGLDEGHALDVSDRATQLDDAHVWLLARIINRYL